MLNPSTAESENLNNDPRRDDATIRKLVGFTARAGYDGFMVANVSPWRSKNPSDLHRWFLGGADIWRRTENDAAIESMADKVCRVVVAWGANADAFPELRQRADEILNLVRKLRGEAWRLGEPTKGGHPRHPVRLGYSTAIEVHR